MVIVRGREVLLLIVTVSFCKKAEWWGKSHSALILIGTDMLCQYCCYIHWENHEKGRKIYAFF